MWNRSYLVILVLAAGCGTSIQATMINPTPHATRPRPPETVEMFSSGPPPRPHVDVAYLEAEQQSSLSWDGTPEFMAQLRAQAARMGCDGVVLGGITHAADSVVSATADVNASRKGITATCIMYLPEAVAATPPPAEAPPAPPPLPPAASPPTPPPVTPSP